MSRHSDLDHIQTPPDERGAQWWLAEHAQAEQAVTSAANMVERSRGEYMHDVATALLDQRLDHLEAVEDMCDALLCELRETAPDVADMVERHYLKGEPWGKVAERHGMSCTRAWGRVASTLVKTPLPALTTT